VSQILRKTLPVGTSAIGWSGAYSHFNHPLDYLGAEGGGAAPGRDRLADEEPLAEREAGAEGDAGPDPDRPSHAQLRQVGEDEGGARPADPGRLDRQRPAVRRRARIPPQPARVVAHLRLLEQLLGEQQGAAGVADEDRVRGDRRGRAQARGHDRGP